MVSSKLCRVMCLLLAVLLIIGICHCQISYSPSKRFEEIMSWKRAAYSADIKAAELHEFIKLMAEYKKLGFDKDIDVSSLDVMPEEALNWYQRLWFRHHYWDANRFFYVQQRVIYILQALDIHRDAQATLDLLQDREDELSSQMCDLQKKRIKATDIPAKEMLLISTKEQELRELLK